LRNGWKPHWKVRWTGSKLTPFGKMAGLSVIVSMELDIPSDMFGGTSRVSTRLLMGVVEIKSMGRLHSVVGSGLTRRYGRRNEM
jgi:hypothetical protein